MVSLRNFFAAFILFRRNTNEINVRTDAIFLFIVNILFNRFKKKRTSNHFQMLNNWFE